MSKRDFSAERPDDAYWREERPLLHWEAKAPVPGEFSGFDFLDEHLRWLPHEFPIFAGPYSCGKSSLARLFAYKWADTIGRRKGLRASIVGWEDDVADVKAELERYALEGRIKGPLSDADARRVVDMQSCVGWTERLPNEPRTIKWYQELVDHRVRHDDVGFFIFDPFNEHNSTRGKNQTETEYVAEVTLKFQRLVRDLKIILGLVTHVSAKSYDESGAIRPFRLANAAGSVQFGNRADRGICVVRTGSLRDHSTLGADDHTVIRFDKCRNEARMGRRGTIACVFDPANMTLQYDHGATQKARTLW